MLDWDLGCMSRAWLDSTDSPFTLPDRAINHRTGTIRLRQQRSPSMTEYQIPGRVPDDSTPRDAVSNYWRERYTAEPYYDDELFFEDYEPAYRIGHAARAQDMIRAYEEVERELESRWASERGRSRLDWAQARSAVRRGWEEAQQVEPRLARGP
jgi:hypothetical protein